MRDLLSKQTTFVFTTLISIERNSREETAQIIMKNGAFHLYYSKILQPLQSPGPPCVPLEFPKLANVQSSNFGPLHIFEWFSNTVNPQNYAHFSSCHIIYLKRSIWVGFYPKEVKIHVFWKSQLYSSFVTKRRAYVGSLRVVGDFIQDEHFRHLFPSFLNVLCARST